MAEHGVAGRSVAEVRETLERLDAAVTAVQRDYGDTLGVRRLLSDIRRIAEDLAELGEPQPGHRPAAPTLEEIPDTPYDRSMWADADDEGFGAPDRRAP